MNFTEEQQAELEKQAAALGAQRDAIVEEANKQIVYLNGRIDQLEALIQPEPEAPLKDTEASEG